MKMKNLSIITLAALLGRSGPLIGTNRKVAASWSDRFASKTSRKCQLEISLNNFIMFLIIKFQAVENRSRLTFRFNPFGKRIGFRSNTASRIHHPVIS